MNDSGLLPIYIVDTHSLYWYRRDARRLSPAADAVFRLAAAGEAFIIVPAIVIAELFYLTSKLGNPTSPSVLFTDIARSREFVFSPLGQEQLEIMETIDSIPEMHDRLIAAEALLHQAPVISIDQILKLSGVVEVIW
jgi:PIN domain nuclease of toxin-antitoxin system